MAIELVKSTAREFLNKADELYESVSRYLNGSDDASDVNAYDEVRELDRRFIDALNEYWNDNYAYGLNYELAESFID